MTASIEPCETLAPLDLTTRPTVNGAKVLSRCGKLPRHVAERQLSSASAALEKSGFRVLEGSFTEEQSESPGSSILAYSTGNGAFLASDAIGAKGKRAEEVGGEVASKFLAAANSGACIDSNLADMLIPLLSLAAKTSRVRVHEVTSHLESGLSLAKQFTSCRWSVVAEGGNSVVTIIPNRSG